MEIMIIGWLILSAFCGWVAAQKGRSFLGWMLLSVLLSPLIAIIGLIAVPALPQRGAYQPSDARPSTPRSDMGFPDLPPRRDE